MAKKIMCTFGTDIDSVAGWIGSYGGGDSPSDIQRGIFATEVGVPRLLRLFERYGLKTTFFIPGHSLETFPKEMEMIVKAGHEIGAHGYLHENPVAMTPTQEEARSSGGGGSLLSASVLAAFLGKVGRHAMAAVSRLDGITSSSSRRTGVGAKDGEGEGGFGVDLHFAFAVPDSYPESTRRELADAAHASGATGGSSAVDASECAAAAYRRKFSGDDGIDGAMMKERIIVVVEVGHVRSRVTVLLHGGDGGGGRAVEVLSSASSSNLGAFLVDVALREHFLETHPKLKSEEIPRDSRRSQRLLAGCNKLKHVLSMLPEGKLAVENVGKDDADVDLSITREHLEILCKASVVDPLTSLIGKRRILSKGYSQVIMINHLPLNLLLITLQGSGTIIICLVGGPKLKR